MWTQKKKKKYLLVKPTSDYFHSAIRESIWTIVPYNPCVLFPPISLSRPAAGCPRWILSHTNSGRPVLTLRDATSILSLLVRMDRSCKAPPSGRQGRAFLHLARFLLFYLFLLLPAPRFPVDNLLPPLLPILWLPNAPCPMSLSLPPHLPTPRFARSLFFIVSFFPLLYLLFSHLFNVSRQPPAFLAFSVRRSVYTSASNNRKLCIVHERQYGIFVTVLVSFLLRRLLFTRFCERDEENKLLPARENASKIYTYFT